jgi:hypothetical protein
MRKLLMLAVVAVVAFAVVAAPASGQQRLDPNPTFPHNDFDPENWVAVDATNWSHGADCNGQTGNCAIGYNSGVSNPFWGVRLMGGPGGDQFMYETGSCSTNGIEGRFDADGDLTVTDGPGVCWSYGPYPGGYPWAGESCLNVSTGETWVRLWAQLETAWSVFDGEMFGRVVDSQPFSVGGQYMDFGGSILNAATAGYYRFDNYAGTKFPIADDVEFPGRLDETQENYVPCSWPELQA